MKTIEIEASGYLSGARTIEDILCLATLVANKAIPAGANVFDAQSHYDSIDESCENCQYHKSCLACIINE